MDFFEGLWAEVWTAATRGGRRANATAVPDLVRDLALGAGRGPPPPGRRGKAISLMEAGALGWLHITEPRPRLRLSPRSSCCGISADSIDLECVHFKHRRRKNDTKRATAFQICISQIIKTEVLLPLLLETCVSFFR